MAAHSTVLTTFADNGDSRTFITAGHTAVKPKLVIQKRKVPSGSSGVAETTLSVIQAAVDAESLVLPQKVSMSVTIRTPVQATGTTVADALVILRDLVAGDAFGTAVTTQGFIAS